MILVYAAAYGIDGGDFKALGFVETPADAEALCEAYVDEGRVGADPPYWGEWYLEWIELTTDLSLDTIYTLLQDTRFPEPRLHGDDSIRRVRS